MYLNLNKIIWYLFIIIEEDNEKPVDAFSAKANKINNPNDIEDLENDSNDMKPETYDYIEKIIQRDR